MEFKQMFYTTFFVLINSDQVLNLTLNTSEIVDFLYRKFCVRLYPKESRMS